VTGLHVTSNAGTLGTQLAQMVSGVTRKVYAHVAHWGLLLNARVKANAAGRPGPRQVTGDYNRSWTMTMTRGGGSATALVGTNKVQGPRLEFGFVGVDAAGRHYDQPPYAHAGPAADAIEGPFEIATAALIDDLLSPA
jgi:hypothetical protein